ncbi:HAMP domain-containing protein [Saccharibacter sp. EH611]|nr:HAMP domain-containing protein [Saccharibacter sp. EH611]MXV58764.1 HAMP domain-containing protein [Saccharibacter sp. EH70]MXV65624.1 HAMP domain-containing protein [Saccharibacter sp. EH60]
MTVRRLFPRWLRSPRQVSPLLVRVLLVNIVPLMLLAGMLLYINQFQASLLEADVTALREQAHIYAGALGESAVRRGDRHEVALEASLASPLLASLMNSSLNAHARLYSPDGHLLVDSRRDFPPDRVGGVVVPGRPERWSPPRDNIFDMFYAWVLLRLPLTSSAGPVPLDNSTDDAALTGSSSMPTQVEMPPYIRRTDTHELVITVVEPIIADSNATIGEIQLTRHAPEIDRSLFAVRSSILSLFLLSLCLTVLLSLYLSSTIARPLRRLVKTSHDMREPGKGRADCVPQNLLNRKDEIGTLARALRISTLALWARLDDTERFAAEVSHELKNPLSSIRSALETLPRIHDAAARDRLLNIVSGDVGRLERLIADISDASRVEGDLRRGQRGCVEIVPLLNVLVEMHQTTRRDTDPILRLKTDKKGRKLCLRAVEDRLVQVLRNLINNALSFSPEKGVVTIAVRVCGSESPQQSDASRRGKKGSKTSFVEIVIEDEGPGIPPAKIENIFERFYSERPGTEDFGQHSGLGLAISRQIVRALGGDLYAENRYDASSSSEGGREVNGARFIIHLPRCWG